MEPTTGFEPVTPSLPRKCSTPEPRGLETLVESPEAGAWASPCGQNRAILHPPSTRVKPLRSRVTTCGCPTRTSRERRPEEDEYCARGRERCLAPGNRRYAFRKRLSSSSSLSSAVHGLRLGRAWWRADRIARGAHALAVPEGLAAVVSRCRSALGLPGVEILGSPEIAGPVIVGARRPLILLPSRFFNSASPEELAAALGHEMSHVRRRDYALHLLCEVLLLPVAFHPAAWLVRRRLAQTREMACDEAALETLVGPRVYARSLLSLAAAAAGLPRPSTTLGVLDAHTLEVRMKRILDHGPRLGARPARALLGTALLLLAGIGAAASAFSVEAVAAGTGDLAPFAGTWSGDWPVGKDGKRPGLRALDLEIRPGDGIVQTLVSPSRDGRRLDQDGQDRAAGHQLQGVG
jgi:hypothetical protein